MDYKKTGHDVFQAVGGNDNVTAVTHCATRLRFHLQNAEKVKQSEVEKIPGVLKCVYANGEMQVVIGPNVTVAYEGVQEKYTGAGAVTAESESDKGWVERFLGLISGIFTPIIPAITAAGMVKAVLAILRVSGAVNVESMSYKKCRKHVLQNFEFFV